MGPKRKRQITEETEETEETEDDFNIEYSKKKINIEYSKNKVKKRSTRVTIGYQAAVATENPLSVMARVQVGYEKGMGVSVYVKGQAMHKRDYVFL